MTAIGAARRRPHNLKPAPARAQAWARRVGTAEVGLSTRITTWMLGGITALGLWLLAFGLLLSTLTESHAQHDLYNRFRGELADGTAPVSDNVTAGTPLALLSSAAAELHGAVVVQGTTSTALRQGPGHLPGGVLPGQAGVSQIMGRATTYGAPFAHIASLHTGDVIKAITGQGTFHYVVQDVRHAGDPFPPALKAGGSQLTLATSEGVGWRSGWAPSRTVFVDAVLRDKSVATPTPGGIRTTSDGLQKTDTSGLFPLVLWVQLLLVTVGAAVWAWARWGKWQTWLVGTPVALAALWGATGSFWLLLPNMF